MTIRLTLSATILLGVGLFLAACAAETGPAAEAEPAADLRAAPTDTPPAVSEQPATPSATPAAESTATDTPSAFLPDLGPAPDITNEIWLNTDQPLNLSSLRGEVVLVEFWTFG